MKFKSNARKVATLVLCIILPERMLPFILSRLGHSVSSSARIGFSFLFVDRLHLDHRSRIGHFNFIAAKRVVLRQYAGIGGMNVVRGPVSVHLKQRASIGNRNTIARARRGVTTGPSALRLGEGTKVTASHKIDCTSSVQFGSFSILAGASSQIWTHGYVHDQTGPGRYRVDGNVYIGNNVYLGSRVIVTGGVRICDAASIGVGVCVTKNLTEPAFYVSGTLRKLPKPIDPAKRTDLERVCEPELIETVYRKRNALP